MQAAGDGHSELFRVIPCSFFMKCSFLYQSWPEMFLTRFLLREDIWYGLV